MGLILGIGFSVIAYYLLIIKEEISKVANAIEKLNKNNDLTHDNCEESDCRN